MLNEKQVAKLKDALDTATRPMFFFDDDTDGLTAFLLLYRRNREGVGVIVKAKPILEPIFARKSNDYGADKVFVLDMPTVAQGFIDSCKAPIFWIDHHPLQDMPGVNYFNPLSNTTDNFPTSYCAWQVVGDDDLWIAMVGVTYDWVVRPELMKKFRAQYPDLLEKDITHPGEALFDSKLGKIIRMFQFSLKGPMSEVQKAIKIFTKINSPYELLNKLTPSAKVIVRKFEKVEKEYQRLMKESIAKASDDPLLIFIYTAEQYALSTEVSNELIYRFPNKVILVGRDKDGYYRCSLRSVAPVNVRELLEKASNGLDAKGGGHAQACGCMIASDDFKQFTENLRREMRALENTHMQNA